MTAHIKALPTFAAEVQANVVEVLEDYLAMAKSGDLRAVAVCGVLKDKQATTTRYSATECMPTLIGASSILNARLLRDLLSLPAVNKPAS